MTRKYTALYIKLDPRIAKNLDKTAKIQRFSKREIVEMALQRYIADAKPAEPPSPEYVSEQVPA